jgi:hypothetical protein
MLKWYAPSSLEELDGLYHSTTGAKPSDLQQRFEESRSRSEGTRIELVSRLYYTRNGTRNHYVKFMVYKDGKIDSSGVNCISEEPDGALLLREGPEIQHLKLYNLYWYLHNDAAKYIFLADNTFINRCPPGPRGVIERINARQRHAPRSFDAAGFLAELTDLRFSHDSDEKAARELLVVKPVGDPPPRVALPREQKNYLVEKLAGESPEDIAMLISFLERGMTGNAIVLIRRLKPMPLSDIVEFLKECLPEDAG